MTPLPPTTLDREQLRDRIRGCLFGNAVGDAYGLATEFMSQKTAAERYGNGPIAFGADPGYPFWKDNHRAKWNPNDFTDDTDQLLLLLQSLEQTRDGRLHPVNFANRLKEWSRIGFPELGTPPRGIGFTVGSTLTHPEFTSNPHKAAYDIWNTKGRTLAANGAVMRTAVLGTESFWDEARVVENALAAAKVTHADPRSIVSALVSSVLISRLLRGGGQTVDKDVARDWNPKLAHEGYRQELLKYLQRGMDIEHQGGLSLSTPEYEPEGLERSFKEKVIPQSDSTSDLGTKQKQSIGRKVKEFLTGSPSRARESPDDWNKDRPPIQLRKDIGWAGIDRVGQDDATVHLARSVLQDYRFLLLETELVPATIRINALAASQATNPDQQLTKSIQERWAEELEVSCFPGSLQQLELGDPAKMGYTFKCIGVGYYSVSRQVDPSPTVHPQYEGPQGLFRGVMEEVTLQAGDADTNGAVVGSLLGARFGLEEGIPKNWWKGLRHLNWFETTVDNYTDRVLAGLDEYIRQQE